MKRSRRARRSARRCRAGRPGRALSTSIRRRPFAAYLREHRLDQRRLAGAARAGQQHVVRRQPGDELPRVLRRSRFSARRWPRRSSRRIACGCAHRLQVAAPAALAPAKRDRRLPVGRRRRRRQQRLDAREQLLRRARSVGRGRGSCARRSAPIVGVDDHVVVRKIAGPHGRARAAAAERHAHA